jgi:hypothetical protein
MDRKLFTLTEGTPALTDKFAFGNEGYTKNITLTNLATLLAPAPASFKSVAIAMNGWNMTSYQVTTVPISSLGADIIPRIRGMKALIIDDAHTIVTDLTSAQNGTSINPPLIQAFILTGFFGPAPVITVQRRTGGFFTNGNYVNDSISRGWVIVDYVE